MIVLAVMKKIKHDYVYNINIYLHVYTEILFVQRLKKK